jgi:hypothetical protein
VIQQCGTEQCQHHDSNQTKLDIEQLAHHGVFATAAFVPLGHNAAGCHIIALNVQQQRLTFTH